MRLSNGTGLVCECSNELSAHLAVQQLGTLGSATTRYCLPQE